MLGGISIWQVLLALGIVMVGASVRALWRGIHRMRHSSAQYTPSSPTASSTTSEE